MNSVNQKTILIAAPGSGIGKSITTQLLQDNYNVVGIGQRSSKMYFEDLISKGFQVNFFECDCTKEKEVENAFKEMRKSIPKIDGMIHLIGGSFYSKAITDLKYDEYRKVISVNLDSAFLLGRETLRWMQETEGGNIVLFGSTTGFKPSNKKLPYGVAKAGIHAMTWFFAQEGSKYGVITNTISPGYVMTERHVQDITKKAEKTNKTVKEVVQSINSKNPLKQSLQPDDIFPLVKLLLETQHIQGQIIRVDSGQILG
ncbi:MAG: SDR family NAD(P)-dependent oxidoreductase [Candidatus Heimdallarchaeaceae archaeon]